ncbi:MAG: hypothetical protein N2484_13580 [Clostridia bacterium]|nr:hypothetical protein [Clostridia bacterium]
MVRLKQTKRKQRRPLGTFSSYTPNFLSYRNPVVNAWWSAAFPGFGHIAMCIYVKGFLLMAWEFYINLEANINLAIFYSFTGDFDLARNVLNKRWVFLYIPVYIYTIWDTYRTTIDLNKFYILSIRANTMVTPFSASTLSISFLDRRTPWLAAFWSALTPGMGQLYNQKIPSGFIILVAWIAVVYMSNILTAIQLCFVGLLSESIRVLNIQWLLFIPSMYGFNIWNAYAGAVELNKLFEMEQQLFLESFYQSKDFKMPI